MKTLEQKMYEHRILREARRAADEAEEKYRKTQDYEDLKKWNECNEKMIEIFCKIHR